MEFQGEVKRISVPVRRWLVRWPISPSVRQSLGLLVMLAPILAKLLFSPEIFLEAYRNESNESISWFARLIVECRYVCPFDHYVDLFAEMPKDASMHHRFPDLIRSTSRLVVS